MIFNDCELIMYMKTKLFVQLKDLLTRTIDTWVNLFDESNKDNLPQLCMELMSDNGQMVFNPSYEHLEELILFVVQQIANTLQAVRPLYVKFVKRLAQHEIKLK